MYAQLRKSLRCTPIVKTPGICYELMMRKIGDLVSILIDNKPSIYARIEGIERDIKPHWFQVRLLFLSFPPQEITWILKEEYLEGIPFTMKNEPLQIVPLPEPGAFQLQPEKNPNNHRAQVISLEELRKKRNNKDS